MNNNEQQRQVPVGKSIAGSAIYGEDGTYVFTPYAESSPEKAIWVPLATVENGKLECSKNKVRIMLTMDRADFPTVIQTFVRAFGKLIGRTSDKRVQKMYKMAATERPSKITERPAKAETEIPTFP